MKLFYALFTFSLVKAQNIGDRIECYTCEYRISDRGDESGAACLTITEKTPKKSYEKMKTHAHHGPGQTTKSRTDCAVIQGEGVETVIEKGLPVQYKFNYLARHDWDNFEDTVAYDYAGNSLSGVEYREKTQECGYNVDRCARGVYYPISRKVTRREILEADKFQQCPSCRKEEYMSTLTNAWVQFDGQKGCDDNPQSSTGVTLKDCYGICVVDQEEYMFNGGDYKKQTYRWCHNDTNRDRPDWDITIKINTRNVRLCNTDKCNDDDFNGSNHAIQMIMSFTLLLCSLTLIMLH